MNSEGQKSTISKKRDAVHALSVDLGNDHCSALDARESLAVSLYDAGHYHEASHEAYAVLQARIRSHPPWDFSIARTRGILIMSYSARGDWDEAAKHQRDQLNTTIEKNGANHERTLASRYNLAIALRNCGRTDEARAERQTVLRISSRMVNSTSDARLLQVRDAARAMQI